MINTNIIKELEKGKKGHKLFDNQKSKDLHELEKILKERDSEDIVVSFDLEEWDKVVIMFFSQKSAEAALQACRKYVSLKLLEELTKRKKELEELNGKRLLEIFKAGDQDAYQQNKEKMLSLKDVIDIIEIEKIPIERIHFIMNGNQSEFLCDAVTPFLEDDLPFSTSIYNSPNEFYTTIVPDREERIYLWQAFNYTSFKECEDGVENKAYKRKTKEKK